MADGVIPKKAAKMLDETLETVAGSGNATPLAIKHALEEVTRTQGIDRSEVSQVFVTRLAGMLSQIPKEQYADAVSLIFFLVELTDGAGMESLTTDLMAGWVPELSSESLRALVKIMPASKISDKILGIIEMRSIESGFQDSLMMRYADTGLVRRDFIARFPWGSLDPSVITDIIDRYHHTLKPEVFFELFDEIFRTNKMPYGAVITFLEAKASSGIPDLENWVSLLGIQEPLPPDDASRYSRVLEAAKLPGKALDLLNSALKAFPSHRGLLRRKAEILYSSGSAIEAYEILKELIKGGDNDGELVSMAMNIAYSQSFLDEFLDLCREFPEIARKKPFSQMKIDAELQKSMFGEAIRDIAENLASNPSDVDLLKMKFRAHLKLNNSNEAFNTAIEILKYKPGESEVLQYVVNSLFDRGEFSQVISILEKDQAMKNANLHLLFSSLIQSGSFVDAINLINASPDLAMNPAVLDAIFFSVRDEDTLKRLESFSILNRDKSVALKFIIGRLRGLPINYDLIDADFLDRYPAQSLLYIRIWRNLYGNLPLPDFAAALLSKPGNRSVKNTVDLLYLARSGKTGEDILDSAKYLFPISESFILDGKLDRAEAELLRTPKSEKDPFYLYLIALIDFTRGDFASARKNNDAALERMFNCDFLVLGIQISMAYDEPKKVREYSEKLVAMGPMESLNLERLHGFVSRNGLWKLSSEFVSIIEADSAANPWVLRLKRDSLIASHDYAKASEQSQMLFRTRQFRKVDIDTHILILKKSGKDAEITGFLQDLETDSKTPEIEIMLGNHLHDAGKHRDAVLHFSEAVRLGADPYTLRNYIDSMIEDGQIQQAQEMVTRTGDKLLQMKIYQKEKAIPAALDMLRKLDFKKPEDELVLRYAADYLWYNRDVRDLLVKIYADEGFVWLGRIIATKTLEDGDKKLALEIARNMNRNEPGNLEIVRLYSDLLVRSGERTEAIELLIRSMRFCKDFEACLDMINLLMRLYYEDRDYDAIKKFYETNPKYIDSNSLQYVIRSYIETDDFEMAEKIMSRYEGSLLKKDVHSELMEDLNARKEFAQTLLYVSRLLKVEYKARKKFDKKEAFYKADIPIEKIEDVFAFLDSREFYFDVNEEKYEVLSRDVIQKAVKNYPLSSIKDLTIAVIFNNLDRRDPIIARNLYIYIQDQMEIARHPQTKNDVLLRLLKRAIKNNVKQEPLNVAFHLQIGISEALEVITLMEYISRMNEESGI